MPISAEDLEERRWRVHDIGGCINRRKDRLFVLSVLERLGRGEAMRRAVRGGVRDVYRAHKTPAVDRIAHVKLGDPAIRAVLAGLVAEATGVSVAEQFGLWGQQARDGNWSALKKLLDLTLPVATRSVAVTVAGAFRESVVGTAGDLSGAPAYVIRALEGSAAPEVVSEVVSEVEDE